MTRGKSGVAVGALVVALVIGALVASTYLPDKYRSYRAINLGTFTARQLDEESERIAPEMLNFVYRAFGETDEAEIYATLERVAAGGALEALYLERRGALSDGGLDRSAGSAQEIHEMDLIGLSTRREDATLHWDARWRVVGTVSHGTHMHVRGNIYAATLTVQPVDGAWRITAFDLTDVDRSEAGTLVAIQQ